MTSGLNSASNCSFFHFGLIVTGKGERSHLPKLFRSLMETGICTFRVISFTDQLSPITSETKKLKMVGSGTIIPSKEEWEIGIPARKHLKDNQCHFVIVIDDLEYDRRDMAQDVYHRYRLALDTMLNDAQRGRAAVHFLVNMLEAYYFADANAVNTVLSLAPPLIDHEGNNVETIRNPKVKLKGLHPGFHEVNDGGKILSHLDMVKVLSNPGTCAYLRTLYVWCVQALRPYPYFDDLQLGSKFCLADGVMSEITRGQIEMLLA